VDRIPLIGRDAELARLRAFVATIPRHGCGLALVGDPGIGKSALIAATIKVAHDAGYRILKASGVESEALLPYAALDQLLRPVMDQVGNLPERQRGVLLGALGRTGGESPDQYLVALATLDLLAEVADDAPVLVVVDDAHWVDVSTARVLSFVARRLDAEPIGLVVALRSDAESLLTEAGFDEVEILPLGPRDSDEILRLRDPDMRPDDRRRVLHESAGNPLALVELPISRGAPETALLTSRLNRAFGARLDGLSPETMAVLVVAAVDDGDRMPEILMGASNLLEQAVLADAIDVAVDRNLVAVDNERLRFRHPILRSVILQAVTARERRLAHAALSAAIQSQPERSVWHRAASIGYPSEQIAGELEGVAIRAERRGNPGVGLEAWERAAQLSEDVDKRLTRLLRAAHLALEIGALERSASLAADAEDIVDSAADRARIVLIRDAANPGNPRDLRRIHALVDAAIAVSDADDPGLALQLLNSAALRGWWADADHATRSLVIDATRALDLDRDPRSLAVLGQADPVAWAPSVVEAVAALRPELMSAEAAALMGTAFLVGGADRTLSSLQHALAEGLRLQGRVHDLPALLAQQVWTAINLADWSTALPAADEGIRLARETGQLTWLAASQIGAGMIAALRGDHDRSRQLVDQAEAAVLPLRVSALLCGIQLTRGVAAIGTGDYENAFAALRREFTVDDPAFHEFQNGWAFGDLAEAGFYSGRIDEVRAIADRQGEAIVSPWHAVAAEYAAPFLVEDDTAAGAAFERTLKGEVVHWPVYRVRTLINYGSWLRRHQRTSEARTMLRDARDAADALGLSPWAEKARAELEATGEQSRARQPASWESLSPQELQVARLAATGMSNQEIGQRLFLSHRTVGSHLYHLFPKLGVSNRAQLAAAVAMGMP